MTLVFLSHAGVDKPHMRPIVDGLLAEQFTVFVDRPLDLTPAFKARELKNWKLRYLVLGEDWDRQIEDMLHEADVVLGCLSPALKDDRRVLETELKHARIAKKLVTCLVNGARPQDLPKELDLFRPAATQSVLIDSSTLASALRLSANRSAPSAGQAEELERFDFVCEEIKRRAAEGAKRAVDPEFDPAIVSARPDRTAAESLVLRTPRRKPVRTVGTHLNKALSGGVFPLIVAGPRNEVVDGFVDAIPDIFLELRPKARRPHVLPFIDISLEVGAEAVDFEMKRSLSRELQFGDHEDFDDDKLFAERLARRHPDQIILCVSSVVELTRLEEAPEAVTEWLRFWARLAAAGANPLPRLAPVLPVVMASAEPGWDLRDEHPCPPCVGGGWRRALGLGPSPNQRFHKRMRDLETLSRHEADLPEWRYAHLLHPVRLPDWEAHVRRNDFGLAARYEAGKETISQAFRANGGDRHGMTMEQFRRLALSALR